MVHPVLYFIIFYLWPKVVGGWNKYGSQEGEEEVVKRISSFIVLKVRFRHL